MELQRKIIHVDMDCFYAAIEVRDHPEWKGKPLVVGGGQHGVVLTASYEARAFGIHSAMPGFLARQRCPQLVRVPPRFAAYKEASKKIHEIFYRYTSVIEPISLDEAYLDVTSNTLNAYATHIAKRIQRDILDEVGITCSAGVAANKLVAKIASDYKKPFGLTVVTPQNVEDFMAPLALRKIPGIGPVSERKLHDRGLKSCQDVWNLGEDAVVGMLGERYGRWLYRKSKGICSNSVGRKGIRKSIGMQRSIGSKLHTKEFLEKQVERICFSVGERLKKSKLVARTVTVKVRFSDFQSISRSRTLQVATDNHELIVNLAQELLRLTQAFHEKVRLIGVSVSKLEPMPLRE